jgi:hypothetical protein
MLAIRADTRIGQSAQFEKIVECHGPSSASSGGARFLRPSQPHQSQHYIPHGKEPPE